MNDSYSYSFPLCMRAICGCVDQKTMSNAFIYHSPILTDSVKLASLI